MKVWDEKSALYIMYKGNHKGKQSRRSPKPMAISLKNGEKQRKTLKSGDFKVFLWQGHKDLNPEPTVLETAALPIELYPYMVGLRGLEPRTDRL